MAKVALKKGTTSKRLGVFIQDSSKTTGEGLTALLFNSAGLTWYYWREDEGNADATSVTLATATRGTFTSGGFIEKDATNLPGFYEIGIPNAALATGAGWVVMGLKGATNMAELTLEVQLTDNTVKDVFDEVTHASYGLDQLVRSTTPANTLDVTATGAAGIDWGNVENQSTSVNFSATTTNLVNTATAVTNNVNAALIDGAHGGTSAVLTLERIVVASTTAGEPAMKLTGNTTGAGLEATGGDTGAGVNFEGGSSGGNGIRARSNGANVDGVLITTSNGHGLNIIVGGGAKHGIQAAGNGSGDGMVCIGGTVGHGIRAIGGATSGDAFKATAPSGNEFSGSLLGSVNSVVTGVTVTTNNDKTGYALTVADKGDIIDRTWDEVLNKADHDVSQSAGKRLRQLEAAFVITSGTAQAGTATTITLAATESATDNIFNGDRVIIVGGTGLGEHGIIIAYNGTTKIATMSRNWVITPDATSEYDLVPADVDIETIENSKAAADNLKLDYDGTGLDKSNSTIGTATNLTTNNDKTGYSISGAKTTLDALNDISPAQVKAEVVDALTADTYAEPGSPPAATASLKDKIGWNAVLSRNKITQTSSTQTLRNDADAGDIGTAAVSDDGTTATRDEWT